MERFVFIVSLVLLLIPFIGGYSRWEEWIVFSIGLLLAIIAGNRMLRSEDTETLDKETI